MLDKILSITGKLATIIFITAISLMTLIGAMYLLFKFLMWLGGLLW